MAEVKQSDLPAVAGDSVIVLRFRQDVRPRTKSFIRYYLQSRFFETVVMALGSGGPRINIQHLRHLSIPLPDESLSHALEDLSSAADRFHGWSSEADQILRSSFDITSPSEARQSLIQAGRTLRLRAEAAALLDNLGYTLRTRLPYPVAFERTFCSPWTELEGYWPARIGHPRRSARNSPIGVSAQTRH
jgi:hypothetical protein